MIELNTNDKFRPETILELKSKKDELGSSGSL